MILYRPVILKRELRWRRWENLEGAGRPRVALSRRCLTLVTSAPVGNKKPKDPENKSYSRSNQRFGLSKRPCGTDTRMLATKWRLRHPGDASDLQGDADAKRLINYGLNTNTVKFVLKVPVWRDADCCFSRQSVPTVQPTVSKCWKKDLYSITLDKIAKGERAPPNQLFRLPNLVSDY
ncbi:hypothetical protein M514_00628 [Trichuris suis]|uniref:Uncharacterized protein n=1 Tax=Trichuris suis TaxID=68888 RepID=A0A085N735_9BILA|nr:hypothetical protein M513_00628 [Trichuris suis]KFD65281.1 hypothetical protein M514_00628 [Trichuris suis]